MNIRYGRTGLRISYVNLVGLMRSTLSPSPRSPAVAPARTVRQLHDCGANTYGPLLSGQTLSLRDTTVPSRATFDQLLVTAHERITGCSSSGD